MRQKWDYELKIRHAIDVARAFYDKITLEMGANVHVSVGGLDSITLLLFVRKYVDADIRAVSVSGLEDASIRRIHKELGVEIIVPAKSKTQILKEYGFPVISKDVATAIMYCRKGKVWASNYLNGKNRLGELDDYKKSRYMPYKFLLDAPFPISSDCCRKMKEEPLNKWAKENNSYPYLGLLASEGGRRQVHLMEHGCNYYGKQRKDVRSCPFAIFMRQDLLRLALELEVPVPEIYGTIESKTNGTLYTTKAQRTGCQMCGFGVHIEKRPSRFDRLREKNPKEWEFWMYRCAEREDGTKYGWGAVLDYIGVEWEDIPEKRPEQLNIYEEFKL
jgi:3'-phosphoadenosine 5'-phosphosulfate sulfotransferase (PAPS reductase)/FAD synthetase